VCTIFELKFFLYELTEFIYEIRIVNLLSFIAHGCLNCGVVKWVDPVWPDTLKNYLIKLWEMFHEQNLGRIQDKHGYEDELAKLMEEKDRLCSEYHKMVDDVTKMFDW
jgi:hypothetical protein